MTITACCCKTRAQDDKHSSPPPAHTFPEHTNTSPCQGARSPPRGPRPWRKTRMHVAPIPTPYVNTHLQGVTPKNTRKTSSDLSISKLVICTSIRLPKFGAFHHVCVCVGGGELSPLSVVVYQGQQHAVTVKSIAEHSRSPTSDNL